MARSVRDPYTDYTGRPGAICDIRKIGHLLAEHGNRQLIFVYYNIHVLKERREHGAMEG